MPNDLVRLACERASRKFGSATDFNAACFSDAFREIAGTNEMLDGNVVRAILAGRSDVIVLSGGAHYRIVWN